jgi:hypothetical protein
MYRKLWRRMWTMTISFRNLWFVLVDILVPWSTVMASFEEASPGGESLPRRQGIPPVV